MAAWVAGGGVGDVGFGGIPAWWRTPRASAVGERSEAAGRCHGACAGMGMNPPETSSNSLPHHRLIAYQVALELVQLVGSIRIRDAQLRMQARKSAASAALNCAEGAARQTAADKSRAYAIALAECCEACAAIEIAGALGVCAPAQVAAVVELGVRLKNMLSRLIR